MRFEVSEKSEDKLLADIIYWSWHDTDEIARRKARQAFTDGWANVDEVTLVFALAVACNLSLQFPPNPFPVAGA